MILFLHNSILYIFKPYAQETADITGKVLLATAATWTPGQGISVSFFFQSQQVQNCPISELKRTHSSSFLSPSHQHSSSSLLFFVLSHWTSRSAAQANQEQNPLKAQYSICTHCFSKLIRTWGRNWHKLSTWMFKAAICSSTVFRVAGSLLINHTDELLTT